MHHGKLFNGHLLFVSITIKIFNSIIPFKIYKFNFKFLGGVSSGTLFAFYYLKLISNYWAPLLFYWFYTISTVLFNTYGKKGGYSYAIYGTHFKI